MNLENKGSTKCAPSCLCGDISNLINCTPAINYKEISCHKYKSYNLKNKICSEITYFSPAVVKKEIDFFSLMIESDLLYLVQ